MAHWVSPLADALESPMRWTVQIFSNKKIDKSYARYLGGLKYDSAELGRCKVNAAAAEPLPISHQSFCLTSSQRPSLIQLPACRTNSRKQQPRNNGLPVVDRRLVRNRGQARIERGADSVAAAVRPGLLRLVPLERPL